MRGLFSASLAILLGLLGLAQGGAGVAASQTDLSNVIALLSARKGVEGLLLMAKPGEAAPWPGIVRLSTRPGVYVFTALCPRERGGRIKLLKGRGSGNLGLFHVERTTYFFSGEGPAVRLVQIADPDRSVYKTLLVEMNLKQLIASMHLIPDCP